MTKVIIYTDGACRGNPGPGGWGAVLRYGKMEKHLLGYEPETTNNRMELMAAICALQALNRRSTVSITTDSNYVRQGITQWIHRWQQNKWQTSAKKPVKNKDLWQKLHEIMQQHDVSWHWVKGHAGNEGNELADTLANRAIDQRGGNR